MLALLCAAANLAVLIKPVVLWDGRKHAVGEGWVGSQCKTATIKKEDGMIRFRTQDPKTFAEWGFQWAPWKPEFEGTDIRPFKAIALEIRGYGPQLPSDLLLSLRSPGDHHLTVNDSLIKREPKLLDGRWHRIVVPMTDLMARDEKFDPQHVVNVILGVWVEKGDFTVDLRRVELLP
jgi:hypothetical protein